VRLPGGPGDRIGTGKRAPDPGIDPRMSGGKGEATGRLRWHPPCPPSSCDTTFTSQALEPAYIRVTPRGLVPIPYEFRALALSRCRIPT
jgi:hypothetical protein